MTASKRKLLTADDLLCLHSQGVKGELIRGVLAATMATGVEHGVIAVNISGELRSFIKPRRLGRVIASDSGVRVGTNPDMVREPDVAFISAERLPLDQRIRGYSDAIPDLVVEIASPHDTAASVYDKARMWLSHEVRIVWVVDPDTRTVDVHRPNSPVVTLAEADTLDGDAVLPGFTLQIKEIFE